MRRSWQIFVRVFGPAIVAACAVVSAVADAVASVQVSHYGRKDGE